jgi:prepilin-type N-terminal cleavage/methylation domain-containing protein
MLRKMPSSGKGDAGFSLVELMIAMVVGLIVVGAVLALVVSMIRANNQTIQATRLTQELRATAAVIASDLKRAKGVDDPFAAAKSGNAFKDLCKVTASANKDRIWYGYAGAAGPYHLIRINSNGKVEMGTSATPVDPVNCAIPGDTTWQLISSAQVNISALTFTVSGRKIDVTLTGSLANPDSGADSITRTLTQTVFVRSIGS